MIGIFDSGVGGIASFREVRRQLPREDIIYLADRKNSPYGTKTKEELLSLVSRDIDRLAALSAERILIACCTASAVYPYLSEPHRKIATPIISPAAELAATLGGRVTVIATDYTVASHAFSEEIKKLSPSATVTEISAQELVGLVEGGAVDGMLDGRNRIFIDALAEKIKLSHPDVLILGCTHFSHVEGELSARLRGVKVITPAVVGAKKFVAEHLAAAKGSTGRGKVIYV